jgi:luciferase-type oxidoreductase
MLNVNDTLRPGDNPGFRRMFAPERMSFGLFFPIEAYRGDTPVMHMARQIARAQRAEQGGFAALWIRDIPLRDPDFRDLGQVFDPWVYLGYITAHTREIALATGAIIMPLRHPLHTAKAAASVDQLSGGRLVFGVAAGDRQVEFPAFNVDHEQRAELFREHLRVFHEALGTTYPHIESGCGTLAGADVVPKPVASRIPTLVTGYCRQELDWIAQHSDGWINFARKPDATVEPVSLWQECTARLRPGEFMPYAQPLFIDLDADPGCLPSAIHLGFHLGRQALIDHLHALHALGIHHIIFSLKYGRRAADEVLDELIEFVLPHFASTGVESGSAVGAAY